MLVSLPFVRWPFAPVSPLLFLSFSLSFSVSSFSPVPCACQTECLHYHSNSTVPPPSPLTVSPFSFPIPIIFSADRQNVWLINTLRFHFSVACLSPFRILSSTPPFMSTKHLRKVKANSNLSSTILSFSYLIFLVVLIPRTSWMSSRATFDLEIWKFRPMNLRSRGPGTDV